MNHLTDVCGKSDAELQGMDLDGLRGACVDVRQAFHLTGWELSLLLLFALLGVLLVAIVRVRAKEPAWRVIGTAVEGGIYGALAVYFGTAFGLLVAEVVPPKVVGLLFLILALVGLLFAIMAAVRGSGEAGGKVLGFILFLGLCLLLAIVAGYAFNVPSSGVAADEYESYLNVVAIALGIAAGVNAVIVAIYRGVHWAIGWLLVPVNSSWGFVGNILGLMTHTASYNFYKDHGAFHKPSDRRFYVCYQNGFSLKTNPSGDPFAFTEGAVMTANDDDLRKHEGIHALQHYIFGPIYPLSHFFWFIPMAVVGAIVGAAKTGTDAGEGATAMSYYDNPWEIVAYEFGGLRDSTKPLIWGSPGAGIVAGSWIVAALLVFIVLMAVWI
jgi:hypothetical protein